MSINDSTLVQPTEVKPHLAPRRTLNRLALALTGLVAGLFGQYLFSQNSLWDALLLYGIAVILFTRALAGRTTPSIGNILPDPQNLHSGWRYNISIWLVILSAGISFYAYSIFNKQELLTQAWWLYLISLILFIAGGLLLTKSHSLRAEIELQFPNRYVLLLLALIIGLAIFMRLYNFTSQPYGIWIDESVAGLQARKILQEPLYRPIMYSQINISGYLLAAYAVALDLLGNTIYSMRLVSVLFGLGAVVAAYLFGRELHGVRFGLALAFLIAVARWHINFSRIAMTGVDAPLFEFLSLFFLTRLFKRGRLQDAMWAGITIGFGLTFYTAFRLYVVALAIFAILAALFWWRKLYATVRAGGWVYLGHVVIFLFAVWIVVNPLVRFALDNPDSFFYRTRQISIFTKRDQPNLGQALWTSSRKHLLMFNFAGDNNGRHNLPGEPMLDPAMAVLWVLGLGLALVRIGQPANLFFLLLFPIAMLGGIFSVDFEAPQSLRSIAVIPAIIYFCGLSLDALGREATTALKPVSRLWLIIPTVLLAGYITISNGYTYLFYQANNFASWNAFSAPETITGRKMAELGPDFRYFTSPFLSNHPNLSFLAPDVKNRQPLILPDVLPIRLPPANPVALFIHPDDVWIFREAQRLYPNAEFEISYGNDVEGEGPPVVYSVKLYPADIASLQGLDLSYRNEGDDPSALPIKSSRVPNINLKWPDDNPTAGGSVIAEWKGILYIPQYMPYKFRLTTPGKALLEIDGNIIFDNQGEQSTSLILAKGNHNIYLKTKSMTGQVALYWQPAGQDESLIPQWSLYSPPITNNGLQGSFYNNDNWEGTPTLKRIDPFIDTYFHLLPLQRPYTVEWEGWLDVPQSGLYRLGVLAVTEAQLFLDGEQLISTIAPNQKTEANINLTVGLHNILIRYKDSTDRSRLHLSWVKPTGEAEPIPSKYLWPHKGQVPERVVEIPEVEPVPLSLSWIKTVGGYGAGEGKFYEPRDVAVLANGNLVVADTSNRQVQILDQQDVFIRSITGGQFPLEEPLAVAVNSKNEILILDSSSQWVYRYNTDGSLLDRFGGPATRLFHPRGMTVLDNDTVVLADTGTARLAFFNPDGSIVGNIGQQPSSNPGQFIEPVDVVQDSQGSYFVAESATNNRIQRLDSGGTPLNQWPILLSYSNNGPHLALAPDGSLFVTDALSHSLLRYSPTGSLINQWQVIDGVGLVSPVGIYFDANKNQLYITDVQTHQIYVFLVQVE